VSRHNLTRFELNELHELGHRIRNSTGAVRIGAQKHAAQRASELKEVGISYRTTSLVLGVTGPVLRRWRLDSVPKSLPMVSLVVPRLVRLTPNTLPPQPVHLDATVSSTSATSDLRSATIDFPSSSTTSAFRHVIAGSKNWVVAAYGPFEDGRRYDQEVQMIRQSLRLAKILLNERARVTPEQVKEDAIARPFCLHLAVHREFGSTTLADSDGSPLRLSDEDLAGCLAPLAGAPTLIVVSGCQSTRLLPFSSRTGCRCVYRLRGRNFRRRCAHIFGRVVFRVGSGCDSEGRRRAHRFVYVTQI
jgi:hypothetical protein